jgi:hypothetical protein
MAGYRIHQDWPPAGSTRYLPPCEGAERDEPMITVINTRLGGATHYYVVFNVRTEFVLTE